MATSIFNRDRVYMKSAWPFKVKSIGHSMQSFQKYGGFAYWHDGLDIRGEAGESVFTSTAGVVVNIENYKKGDPLYWEVAIRDDKGFVWKYHHVDGKSIPQSIKRAYKKKTRIKQGEYIGNIVFWPVSSHGEEFHHIHLLVIDKLGAYINPFLLLDNLTDSTRPTISKIGILKNGRKVRSNTVTGEFSIYANISDTIKHKDFSLTPYKISYKIDNLEERIVWKFDSLPSVDNDTDYLFDFYLRTSCGNYRCRRFDVNLGFKPGQVSRMNIEPGEHVITVYAYDYTGNKSDKSYQFVVK
jgi:hypothetical protein